MENEITDLIQSTSQENLSEKDEEEGPNLLLINVRSLADQSSSGENDQITPPPNKKSSTSLAKDDSEKTRDKPAPLWSWKEVTVINNSPVILPTLVLLPQPTVILAPPQLTIINHAQASDGPPKTTSNNPLNHCIICNKELNSGKYLGLAAYPSSQHQLNGVDLNAGDFLKWVVYDEKLLKRNFHPLPPPGRMESRKMCSPCSTILKNMYESITKLRNQFNPEGYLGKLLIKENEEGIPQIPKTLTVSTQTYEPLAPLKTKPIGAHIKESVKNSKLHATFTNSVHKMLHQQITNLTKENGLLNYKTGGTDELRLEEVNKDLEIFVKTKCPLLWKVMLALFQKSSKRTDAKLTLGMQIALGIAGRVHNQNCSGLQKAMAIFLWINGGSKNVINTLHRVGLSLSYSGSLNLSEVDVIRGKCSKMENNNVQLKSTTKQTEDDANDQSDTGQVTAALSCSNKSINIL
ncbi:uncharacterized protein LOC110858378 [Folsomia candida]|uniref:Uncharacterized protein n=1 Tax=Folsomia candida TaxID=158441 RepID=A0A226EVN2_FOLCA|nr:uncharacterized protein LOC110858378 [Folsomia candida]XP_035702879.1 uncharacterized protein LOC110858378 [Folsomia candida]XP_035702880.1 uncharacterized protein LOC110858378 [Folsomia candida]OXA61642.1 hypothetical protein Fcan01_00720 [Folsomia candida]